MRGVLLGRDGRVAVPAALRKALRLRAGEKMVWVLNGGDLVLKRRRTVEEELWKDFSRVRGSLAITLIRERRAKARAEVGPGLFSS